jgi:hypothetical protein
MPMVYRVFTAKHIIALENWKQERVSHRKFAIMYRVQAAHLRIDDTGSFIEVARSYPTLALSVSSNLCV